MDLEQRLSRLEERVMAIEQRFGDELKVASPHAPYLERDFDSAPKRFPASAPAHTTRSATAPDRLRAALGPAPNEGEEVVTKPSSKLPSEVSEWESYFGITILGRVGIAAVLLAAAWLAQLAYGQFSATLRVLSVYALGSVLIAAGGLLKRRVAAKYIAILWGGGVAAAYLAGAMARLRYELIDPTSAMVLLIAACALGQALARVINQAELAYVTLIGAFAAPLIVGSPTDARTSLLIYVVILNGWAAYTEYRWRWFGARLVALGGALVVITAWLGTHGAGDHSTHLHLQAYLLGLAAPEVLLAIGGVAMSRERSILAFALVLAGELVTLLPLWLSRSSAYHEVFWQVALVASGLWCALALAARARRGTADHVVRSLAFTATVMLAIASHGVGRFAPIALDREAFELACTVGAGIAAFVASRALGAGDTAALLSAVFAAFALETRATPDPCLPLALVVPTLLITRSASAMVRPAAFILGVLTIAGTFVLCREPGWVFLAFLAAAAWCGLWSAYAHPRRFHLERALVAPVLGCMVIAWLLAVRTVFQPIDPALANWGTAAALAITLSAAWTWRCARESSPDSALRISCATIALVALGMAGFREVDGLAANWSHSLAGLAHTLYLLALGAVYRTIALRPSAGTTPFVLSYVALGAALTFVVDRFQERGVPGDWALVGELVAIAAGIALAGPRAARISSFHTWATWILGSVLLIVWLHLAVEQRFGTHPAILNPRTATGLAIVALIAHLASRADELGPKRVLRLLACVVGYSVGLPEVLEHTRGLSSVEARAAAVSIYSSVAAGAVLGLGFALRASEMRWLALYAFTMIVTKIGLHDLAFLAAPYRIGIAGALGCVMLLGAWGYARRESRLGGH